MPEIFKYAAPTKDVCNACPFRRKSLPGWLGSGAPESFISCINHDDPLPCHKSIDYSDRDWKAKWLAGDIGRTCSGSLTLTANMSKRPRAIGFPTVAPDTVNVFSNPIEFVDHHRGTKIQSWDDANQDEATQELIKLYASFKRSKPVKQVVKKAKAK